MVSAGEDNKVKIWKKKVSANPSSTEYEWELESVIEKEAPVWRVEFSPVGNMLSVCSGDNQTSIYKEKTIGSGDWVQSQILNEEGVIKEK